MLFSLDVIALNVNPKEVQTFIEETTTFQVLDLLTGKQELCVVLLSNPDTESSLKLNTGIECYYVLALYYKLYIYIYIYITPAIFFSIFGAFFIQFEPSDSF